MNRGAVATAGRGTGPGLAASDVPPRANPAIRHEELELAQLAVDTRVRADRVLYFSVNAYDGLCVNRRLRPPAPCVPQAQSLLPEPPARSRGSISASATTTTWSCSGSWLRFAWGECFLETPPYAGNKVARFYIAETASPSFLS